MGEVETALSEVEMDLIAADANLARQRAEVDEGDMSSLPNWFIGKLADIDAASKRITEQAAAMQAQLVTARKAVWWKYGREFQSQVASDLHAQGGKKKSVSYLQGNAGYRSTGGKPQLVIDNEAAL